MDLKNAGKRPDITSTAFWDVDFNKVDFYKNDLFVIEKVANYGTWGDLINVIKFYGVEHFRKTVIKSAYLKKDVLNFICVIFELDKNDFKCYTKRQSLNLPWNY